MVLRKFELEAKLKDDNQLIQSGVLRNEHPLDLSEDFESFCQACRRGDLKRCQELISAGVNINAKDDFDYTPLIIVSSLFCARVISMLKPLLISISLKPIYQASLCGHYELVQLLLESGTSRMSIPSSAGHDSGIR